MPLHGTGYVVICAECGKSFRSQHVGTKRCSDECRRAKARNRGRALRGEAPIGESLIACGYCQTPVWTARGQQRFCSRKCREAAYIVRSTPQHARRSGLGIPKTTYGAAAELRAAADLMLRGFHVYRAMSPSCPCDLVVWKADGPVIRVEVKSVVKNYVTGAIYRRKNADRNVFDVLCSVSPDEVIYEPPVEEW